MSAYQRNASLGAGEKLGYAVGDAGFNFYWIIIGSYLSYFYTDIFGIPAAAAGTMFLVTKIVDACTDPVMGAVADRTRSRWGRFRPYLLFGALPMAGAAVLTMTTPDLDENGKVLWAYGTYTVMMLCYTILSTPYSSLAGVLTADAAERNSVFGLRFFFAYSTGILVGALTPGLADYFGDGNDALGWQVTMALYSAVACGCFLTVFFTTRERIQPAPEQQSRPLEDIRDLIGNGPWLVLFAIAMIIMMTIVFRGSSATYYFKYFVERPDLMGPYIGVQMAAYAVGCLLSPWLTRLLPDKARLLMLLMGIVGALSVAFAFIPKPANTGVVTVSTQGERTLRAADLLGGTETEAGGYRWVEHLPGAFWFNRETKTLETGGPSLSIGAAEEASDGERIFSVSLLDGQGAVIRDSADWPAEIIAMFLLNILISLALGPKSPIAWSMYADAADYNEWKTGRRATAMTFSAATFSQKLGGALGSAGILWVLALFGYKANAMQEDASLTSIVWLQTLVPAFFAFASIAVLRFYGLGGKKLAQIQRELQQRDDRSAGASEMAKDSGDAEGIAP
ncbi:MFS transporter [Microbulbifer halophilus]|uniref:MFS transporter n=1 Tax=Microbulbifer halophilus TaxID=453963 RepID=A0ABW5EFF6_9GAMM|nr:MFS transporter [Microbulbifer halophilus]MCW8126937.1 MFS transporter [Microbulbifer halophilus]